MKGEIILREMERRQDLLNAHEADVAEFQNIQADIADLQSQIDVRKAELDKVGAKVTQFDGGKIKAEIDELKDIAIDLGIIEAPVEEVAEEATPVAEPVDGVENQEGVIASVSLNDLI